MDPKILHVLLSSGAIALGLYLFAHPKVLPAKAQLTRGVVIWVALVLALRGLDYLFQP